jgi:RNA polymerase sigma-70 factor, ECF subfamily
MHYRELPCKSKITEVEWINRRDQKLLAAARAGSNAAFEELQNLFSNRLYKRVLSITRNHEDAEDALQETFMRAFVALNSFQGRSHLATWLTRIAINSALILIRRRRRSHAEVSLTPQSESGAEYQEFDIRDSAPNPEELCDLKQRFDETFNAIDRLDPKSRTVIEIWTKQECSMKELACTLDVPVATVKARLHRARKKLACSIDHEGRKPVSRKRRVFELGAQNRAAICLTCD